MWALPVSLAIVTCFLCEDGTRTSSAGGSPGGGHGSMKIVSVKVREGRLRPDLLRSHLTIHISLNIYDNLMYDLPKNR